jgi:hypothetical protein
VSYNADSIEIVASDGFLVVKKALDDLRWKLEREGHHVPESNLFDQCDEDKALGEFWHPESGLWWYGEGSGHTFDVFVERVLPIFSGSADLVICWEGGDSYSGLRLRDHKVTKHEVVMTLGEESED